MNVLIVDDNEMTRTILRSILVAERHEVVADVGTAQLGLAAAMERRPAMICLDIELPDRSGVEVLRDLLVDCPDAAVLMISGRQDIETIKTCMEMGAAGYILKPFNAEAVLQGVDAALKRNAQRVEKRAVPPTAV